MRISAATVAEALIVAERRGLGAEMTGLVDGLDLEIASVSPAMARRVADTCARWGKGVHEIGSTPSFNLPFALSFAPWPSADYGLH